MPRDEEMANCGDKMKGDECLTFDCGIRMCQVAMRCVSYRQKPEKHPLSGKLSFFEF
jgi:hypothetical protein